MDECRLCPRNCGVNRKNGKLGYCQAGADMTIARYSLHMWEEPCISGSSGSGTIFFSNCNLDCIYCQNYEISQLNKGKSVSVEEFSDICLALQKKGANNINLVTGCLYVYDIIKGIRLAKKRGLTIPVIYNTSGYENVSTIKLLEGIVDVYLPDLKYYDNKLGEKYSNCKDYFKYASRAIEEMYRQVGECKFNNSGIIEKGLIVRHLILPECINDSKNIIKYLYDKYKNNIYLSIMNQYTTVRECKYDNLNKLVSNQEYEKVIDYAYDLGVRNAYVQEGGTQKESFIPDFEEFKGV